jgi:hypothetical protein
LRNALNKKSGQQSFSLLHHPRPLRRAAHEDAVHLVPDAHK